MANKAITIQQCFSVFLCVLHTHFSENINLKPCYPVSTSNLYYVGYGTSSRRFYVVICLMTQLLKGVAIFQEENRARDLFYSLWVPDLFMQRVQSNGQWSLFCPNEAPGLADCWGDEFEKLYTKYENMV